MILVSSGQISFHVGCWPLPQQWHWYIWVAVLSRGFLLFVVTELVHYGLVMIHCNVPFTCNLKNVSIVVTVMIQRGQTCENSQNTSINCLHQFDNMCPANTLNITEVFPGEIKK